MWSRHNQNEAEPKHCTKHIIIESPLLSITSRKHDYRFRQPFKLSFICDSILSAQTQWPLYLNMNLLFAMIDGIWVVRHNMMALYGYQINFFIYITKGF